MKDKYVSDGGLFQFCEVGGTLMNNEGCIGCVWAGIRFSGTIRENILKYNGGHLESVCATLHRLHTSGIVAIVEDRVYEVS